MLIRMAASSVEIGAMETRWTRHQWLTAFAPGVFAAIFFAARAEFAPLTNSAIPGWAHLLLGLVVFSLWAPIIRCAWGLHTFLDTQEYSLKSLGVHALFATVSSSAFLFLVAWAAVEVAIPAKPDQLWPVFAHKWLTFFPLLILLYAATIHAFRNDPEPRTALTTNSPTGPISLWWNGQQLLLPPKAIYWAEAQGDYISLHTDDGHYTLKMTLNALEKRLKPHGFARTRRNALVNIHHIDAVLPAGVSAYKLKLSNGDHAPLARRNKKALLVSLQTTGTNHRQ